MPALEQAAAASAERPRVVTIASIAHKRGRLNFDDLQSTKSYSPMKAYQQSKLADLMFAFELDRRLRAAHSRVMSVAAHPGVASTNLFQVGDYSAFEKSCPQPRRPRDRHRTEHGRRGRAAHALRRDRSGRRGRWLLRTAGLSGDARRRGGPGKVAPQARDAAAAARLWQVCEDLTGIKFL